MTSTRTSEDTAEKIISKQKDIERTFNLKPEEAGQLFSSMASDLFSRTVSDGALSRAESEISSGLTMTGVGLATTNLALVIMGVYQIGMGLSRIGEDDEEFISSHQQIMLELHKLAKLIEDGVNLVLQKQAYISLQLSQLSNQITRIEKFLEKTQKENYLRDFLTLISRLNDRLRNVGATATSAQVKKDLVDLQAWIKPEGHAYRATVTCSVLVSDVDANADFHIEILGQSDFDHNSMMGYLTPMLEQFVSHRLTKPMKHKLPNVKILQDASILYMRIIQKFLPSGNIAPMFVQISDQWKMIADYIKELGNNGSIWSSLCTQIQDYARQANQYITFLEHQNKLAEMDGAIGSLLSEGAERIRLMRVLNKLEVRRLLMIRFWEVLGKPKSLKNIIAALPCKSMFLERTRASLQEANKELVAAGTVGDVQGVKKALENGADPNQIVSYPTRLMGDEKQSEFVKRKNALQILDLLLQYSPSYNPLKLTDFFFIRAYKSKSALTTMIEHGCFEQLILSCASTLETNESTVRMAHPSSNPNSQWATKDFRDIGSATQHKILRGVMRDITEEKGVLNKEDLRTGYAFYRAVQDENFSKINELFLHIKPYVIFWLTAILGDVRPIQELEARGVTPGFQHGAGSTGIRYNDTEYFFPIQLAVLLGQSQDVIKVLSKYSSHKFDKSIAEPISGKTLVTFAEQQGFLDTAYMLHSAGFASSHTQITRICEANGAMGYPFIFNKFSSSPVTYSEEKDSLGKKCLVYSECFTRAAEREQTRESIDAKAEEQITANNYAGAARRILYVLIPKGLSEEIANAYLRDFARHDFIGIALVKINPKAHNEMLQKHMSKILSKYQINGIIPDVIDFSEAISKEITALPASESITDEKIINLIESAIKQALTPQLPPQLETIKNRIERGFWRVVELHVKKIDKPTKKKLLTYLLVNYADAEEENEAFTNLIEALRKGAKKETFKSPSEAFYFSSVSPAFFAHSKDEKKPSIPLPSATNGAPTFLY